MAALKAKLAEEQKLREEAESKAAALAMSKSPFLPVSPTPASFSTAPAPLPMSKSPTLPVSPAPGTFSTTRVFTNSLGMTFLPVPGTSVFFCEHETRVKDYAAYAAATPGVNMEWKDYEYEGHKQTSEHPVVNVSWEEAKAFCQWLSERDGKNYRLPTDHEWSVAIGIGAQEDPNETPEEKDEKLGDVFPWGASFPPPPGFGNYVGAEAKEAFGITVIDNYRDDFAFIAPVKRFTADRNGLFDLSGNVWEWCQDKSSKFSSAFILRGGSWCGDFKPIRLLSSKRIRLDPTSHTMSVGFRCVLVGAAAGVEAR